jgi:hypothetical protein
MAEEGAVKAALEALTRELELYARILEMTSEQRRLAEEGKAEDLLALLAEKGKLTEEAARVAKGSAELKANWAESSKGMESSDRERGQKLLDEVSSTLQQILAEEDACQKALGSRREGAMEELLRLQKGRKMAQAYGKQPPQDPRFKDERK